MRATAKLWDEKYRAENLTRADLDRAALVTSVQVTLARVRPGAEILEAGSGTGRLAVQLARSAEVRVTGIDVSTEAIAVGRELAELAGPLRGSVNFLHADLYDLPFGDGSFDLVLSDSVIEHLHDPLAALRELQRVLRNGGALVVSVPNRWRPDGWDLHRRLARPPYLQKSFSPFTLRRLLRDAGLVPVEMFGDEIWLSRNLALLKASLRRQKARKDLELALPTARARGRFARRMLRRAVASMLPAWLHVSVGVVAERPEHSKRAGQGEQIDPRSPA